jgi:hypothetical protein
MRIGARARGERSDQDAGQKVSKNYRLTEAVGHRAPQQSRQDRQRQVDYELCVLHTAMLPSECGRHARYECMIDAHFARAWIASPNEAGERKEGGTENQRGSHLPEQAADRQTPGTHHPRP